jgi:GT2 family glycosyltransferase
VLRYLDHPDQIQAWGGGSIVPWMGYARHFDAPAELDGRSFLTFASVLLRREMLEQVGLLDDGYFMYFEDSDLCFRARSAGWKLAIAADTAVLHKEGGSSLSKKSARLDRIVTASGLRFLHRHGRPRLVAKALFVLSRLAKRAVRGNVRGMRAVWRGVGDWNRDDPMAFQESE